MPSWREEPLAIVAARSSRARWTEAMAATSLCVQQIGPDMDGFFASWERVVVLLQLRQW
jgi:hypothetical protein